MLCKWFEIAFRLENPLSQIAILDEMSIIFCQSSISLGEFVCHTKVSITNVGGATCESGLSTTSLEYVTNFRDL